MFELSEQTARLTSVNPRIEIHGDEHVLAADLQFEVKMSNDVLSEFDPKLKSALYAKNDGPQGELIEDVGHLPKLKFPLLGPLKWGYDGAGYEVCVCYGVSGTNDIRLFECALNKFAFECQDGGTVLVKFRVQAHPETVEIGRLCELIQHDVTLTLVPPSAEQDEEAA